jgi:MFS family permease
MRERALLGLPRLYWILWGGQFINRLGGFVLTFLPLYLTERLRYTDARAGAVLSLFGLGGLVGASLGGWSSDRFGRRRTLLAALGANATVLLGFGLAPAGPLIALASFGHGVSNAYGPAITAAVSDVVGPRDRARAFGYLYWAVNLGFSLAALVGGALSRRGYLWLFVGDALSTVAFLAIVYAALPETRPPSPPDRPPSAFWTLPTVLVDRRFRSFAAAQFLVVVVFLQAFVNMPLQERAEGVAVPQVGLIAALNGVVIVTAQPLFLRWTRGQPSWRLLAFAGALVALGALGAAHAHGPFGFAACMVTLSLGEVAFSGAAPTFVALVAPTDLRGTFQGAHSLVWACASLLAPLLGPALRVRFGATALWHGAAALCALAAVLHALGTRAAEREAAHPSRDDGAARSTSEV